MHEINVNVIRGQFESNLLYASSIIRSLTLKECPTYIDLLDTNDATIFLEPLLFTYFNFIDKPKLSIEQILWGYIINSKKPTDINVLSDDKGVIYLPNHGYFLTDYPNKFLTLKYKKGRIRIYENKIEVLFIKKDINKLNNFNAHVFEFSNPLIDMIFLKKFIVNSEKTFVGVAELDRYNKFLEEALLLIEKYDFNYYDLLKKSVKHFFLFHGNHNSFATIQANGIAFFNVHNYDRTVFFLDNIVHQCGHIIFNYITFMKEDLFTVPPNTYLSRFTKDQNDNHEIYGLFHGLFTQSNINSIFDRCLEDNYFSGDDEFELIGRMTSNLKRFGVAIEKLDQPDMYSNVGLIWFKYFKNVYEGLLSKRGRLVEIYKIDNQPYVFDYKLFKETNSIKLDI